MQVINTSDIFLSYKNSIGEINKSKDIGILFSGGKDSTAVATLAALLYKENNIKLITISNGHLDKQLLIKNTTNRKKHIEEKTGHSRIKNVFISADDLFKRYGLRPFSYLKDKYKYVYLCIDCKIAMSLAGTFWCSKNNIDILLDGYAPRQWFNPEQTLEFRSIIFPMLEEHTGVKSLSPLYDVLQSDDNVIDILTKLGFDPYGDFGHCNEDKFSWKGQTKCSLVAVTHSLVKELCLDEKGPYHKENSRIYFKEVDKYTKEKSKYFFSKRALREVYHSIDNAKII